MDPTIVPPPNLPKDTHSYKGWLNSDNFLKRAFAIYGYMMVAGLIIMIPFYILMMVMMFSLFQQFIPNMMRQVETNTFQINGQFQSDNLLNAQLPLTSPSSLPTACIDQPEGTPVITSLSSYSGFIGAGLEIRGCNFAGFEGDKNAWIENSQGIKGLLYGETESTDKLLKVILKSPLCQKDTSYSGLPCDAWLALTPGTYKIYATPWTKKSNEVILIIK